MTRPARTSQEVCAWIPEPLDFIDLVASSALHHKWYNRGRGDKNDDDGYCFITLYCRLCRAVAAKLVNGRNRNRNLQLLLLSPVSEQHWSYSLLHGWTSLLRKTQLLRSNWKPLQLEKASWAAQDVKTQHCVPDCECRLWMSAVSETAVCLSHNHTDMKYNWNYANKP